MKEWPKEEYGNFYNGDSYIVLHGEKDEENENVCILIINEKLTTQFKPYLPDRRFGKAPITFGM